MLAKSRRLRDERIVWAETLQEIYNGVENKNFVKAPWCGERECEDAVKEKAQATARVIAQDKCENKNCAICGKKANKIVYFARAY